MVFYVSFNTSLELPAGGLQSWNFKVINACAVEPAHWTRKRPKTQPMTKTPNILHSHWALSLPLAPALSSCCCAVWCSNSSRSFFQGWNSVRKWTHFCSVSSSSSTQWFDLTHFFINYPPSLSLSPLWFSCFFELLLHYSYPLKKWLTFTFYLFFFPFFSPFPAPSPPTLKVLLLINFTPFWVSKFTFLLR